MSNLKDDKLPKFEVSSYTRFKIMKGSQNVKKNGPWTPPHPLWEYFVVHEMGHANIYKWTEFEVSSYTCSKFTKDVPKFTSLFGIILSSVRWEWE